MPRKTKETLSDESKIKKDEAMVVNGKKPKKKVKSSASSSKAKKETTNKTVVKKDEKNIGSSKMSTKKSSVVKEPIVKKTSTKKGSPRASTPTKTTKKTANVKKPSNLDVPEYYDLPYRYSQTLVKLLAQTPKMLFVYWDISEEDRNNLVKTHGENFFDHTLPFLRVKNETLGYSFDVDVDDFANSWYLPIDDANSKYNIELLRKQKPFKDHLIDDEIYITSSNDMSSPNDHILFEKEQKMVYFKNIKSRRSIF